MKTKTKVIFSALLVALLSLIVVLSVALIFAATNQTITSNISVTYTSKEVVGTASAYYFGDIDGEWYDMLNSEGNNSIDFSLVENATLSPAEDIPLNNVNENIFLIYDFTNDGEKPYELILTYEDDNVEDKNVSLYNLVTPNVDYFSDYGYTNEEYNDIVTDKFTGTINTIVLPNSKMKIIIEISVTNWATDASFSGSMNFDLDGTSVSEYTNQFQYYTNGESAVLTGVAQGDVGENYDIKLLTDSSLNVPLTYNDLPVKTLGAFAMEYQTNLTTISSFGNIETIGYNAFEESSLEGSLTIPGTVKNILGGFCDCRGITSLTLENGIENIGICAFFRIGISKLSIPNSVKSIGYNAFSSCDNLTSITIPASVKNIGVNPFMHCEQLTKIVVDSGNTNFTSRNLTNTECNVIIDKTTKTLISGCNNSTIPQDGSITKIGDSAFNDVGLTGQLVIPQGVTSIGRSAFYNCKFTSVIIPSSVRQIGNYAFGFCRYLANVTIDSQTICENLISWESDIFTETDLIDYATTIKAKYEIVGIEDYKRSFSRSASKDSDGYWTYTYNG